MRDIIDKESPTESSKKYSAEEMKLLVDQLVEMKKSEKDQEKGLRDLKKKMDKLSEDVTRQLSLYLVIK